MDCDSPDTAPIISSTVEVAKVSVGEPSLRSVGLQTPHQSSDIVEPPSRMEAHLVHQGSCPRNLRSKRIMAPTKMDSGDALSNDVVPNTNTTLESSSARKLKD